jgi:hypothetical protein
MNRWNGYLLAALLNGAAVIGCAANDVVADGSGGAAGAGLVATGGAAGAIAATGGAAGTSGGAGSGGSDAGNGAAGAAGSNPSAIDAAAEAMGLPSFTGSPCKSKASRAPAAAGDAGTDVQPPAAANDTGALDGLKCLTWKRVGTEGLRIDLVNFREICATVAQGSTSMVGGTLELDVEVTGGAWCGYCLYDWSFDLGGIASADLPVAVRIHAVGYPAIETHQTTLPLSAEGEGTFCQYIGAGALGDIGVTCRGSAGSSLEDGGTPCNPGLTCAATDAGNQSVCLPPCNSHADCPAGGAFACQAGFCQPARPW